MKKQVRLWLYVFLAMAGILSTTVYAQPNDFGYNMLDELLYLGSGGNVTVPDGATTISYLSAPVIKCKKTPRKKCRFVAERREKR